MVANRHYSSESPLIGAGSATTSGIRHRAIGGLSQGRKGIRVTGTLLVVILLGTCTAAAQAAGLRDVQEVMEKYHSTLPQARELTVYQLDWAPTFQQAKERAAQEQRPIFLIVVTNSYGNIYTGHC